MRDLLLCPRPQILDGCPWIFPRPVYVLTLGELRPGDPLASAGGGGGAGGDGEGLVGSTYTLRTKVTQEGAADALAQVRVCVCGLGGVVGWVVESEEASRRRQGVLGAAKPGHLWQGKMRLSMCRG
jgi:hypothetical protein